MAFPGTLDINYYRGDSHEFNVYPKRSNGTVFSLNGYTAEFTIAETRGTVETGEGLAIVSDDYTHIKCVIPSGLGTTLDPLKTYVYDIEIRKTDTPYNKVYTLLTGNINVTDEVTINP